MFTSWDKNTPLIFCKVYIYIQIYVPWFNSGSSSKQSYMDLINKKMFLLRILAIWLKSIEDLYCHRRLRGCFFLCFPPPKIAIISSCHSISTMVNTHVMVMVWVYCLPMKAIYKIIDQLCCCQSSLLLDNISFTIT